MAAAEDLPFACSEDGCTAVSSSFTASRSNAPCMFYVFMRASFVCFESVRHIWGHVYLHCVPKTPTYLGLILESQILELCSCMKTVLNCLKTVQNLWLCKSHLDA